MLEFISLNIPNRILKWKSALIFINCVWPCQIWFWYVCAWPFSSVFNVPQIRTSHPLPFTDNFCRCKLNLNKSCISYFDPSQPKRNWSQADLIPIGWPTEPWQLIRKVLRTTIKDCKNRNSIFLCPLSWLLFQVFYKSSLIGVLALQYPKTYTPFIIHIHKNCDFWHTCSYTRMHAFRCRLHKCNSFYCSMF